METKPIEDADYFVRVVDFHNCAVSGAVLPNDDGTFSVYINNRVSRESQKKALRHEVAHIELDHFYRPDCDAEKEARGEE